jgi:hypothetical protein
MSYVQDYPTRTLKTVISYVSWLNDDMDNIQLAGFSVHRHDRTAASSKTSGGCLCLFVNNS